MNFLNSLAPNTPAKDEQERKHLPYPKIGKKEVNIQVCIRMRPMPGSQQSGNLVAWECANNELRPIPENIPNEVRGQENRRSSKELPDNRRRQILKEAYSFEHLFNPESNTNEVYDGIARNIVLASMQGYHGSICTYGQTGTGKTFTMRGTRGNPGIIQKAVKECFDFIEYSACGEDSENREFVLRVSYLEIYNETVRDLLSPSSTNVRILEDKKKGVIVKGIREETVMNSGQVIDHLIAGERTRHVGVTDANEESSRSHTIFRMVIESRSSEGVTTANGRSIRSSTLSLVDLAGSESARHVTTAGDRKKEGRFINKSLLTLAHIIYKLSDPKTDKTTHLPFRDSKLTRLLQPSLGGNAQIAIICTVTPEVKSVEETVNTIKFAFRAKEVKQKSQLNEMEDPGSLLVKYRIEIHELRNQLAQLQMNQPPLNNIPESRQVTDLQSTEPGTKLAQENGDDDGQTDETITQAIRNLERLILKSGTGRNEPSDPVDDRSIRKSGNTFPQTVDDSDGHSPSTEQTDVSSLEENENTTRQTAGSPRNVKNLDATKAASGSEATIQSELLKTHELLTSLEKRRVAGINCPQKNLEIKKIRDNLQSEDRHFLEESLTDKETQLKKKKDQILEMVEVLNYLEEKNNELEQVVKDQDTKLLQERVKSRLGEETIAAKDKEILAMAEEMNRLEAVLRARENELLELKGVHMDEETF